MKLLFVGTTHGVGGRESHFVALAQAMAEAGHSIHAVVNPRTPMRPGLEKCGVRLHSGVFRNAMDPRGISAVIRTGLRFRPDWIVGGFSKEYWPLALISQVLGVKLALFKHMNFPMRPLTHRFIPKLASRFIVVSEFQRNRFIERGISSSRIHILYNPLDVESFRPDHDLRRVTRDRLGIGPQDVVVGYVGAIDRHKGVLPLVRALNLEMAQLPSLKALWVGNGPALDEVLTEIRAGGSEDRHLRQQWTSDVKPFYAAMDVLALPSIRPETFGRVCIEAQACGVPVLGADIGGIPETINPNVTGLLVPPGDVGAWRNAIRTLALDIITRERMREAGPEWVSRQFSTEVIAQSFARLLENGDGV